MYFTRSSEINVLFCEKSSHFSEKITARFSKTIRQNMTIGVGFFTRFAVVIYKTIRKRFHFVLPSYHVHSSVQKFTIRCVFAYLPSVFTRFDFRFISCTTVIVQHTHLFPHDYGLIYIIDNYKRRVYNHRRASILLKSCSVRIKHL